MTQKTSALINNNIVSDTLAAVVLCVNLYVHSYLSPRTFSLTE